MYVPPWLYETSDIPGGNSGFSGAPVVQSTKVTCRSQVPTTPNLAGFTGGSWAVTVGCEIATAVMIAIIPNVIAVNVTLLIDLSSFIGEPIYPVFRARFVLPK